MLTIRPESPLSDELLAILGQVSEQAQELGTPFFVGGATARDILLTHVLGQKIRRATRDVDLGLYVNDWAEFEALKNRLVASGRFTPAQGSAQRLWHNSRWPLDLIPFGKVAKGQSIAWPPEHAIVMNVAGFEEAWQSALTVQLCKGLAVPTCSLPALAILKLLAWRDRASQTKKDAMDFLLIAQAYGPAQNEDRLYDTETQLLLAAHGDVELAGAQLLGRDAAVLCKAETASAVQSMLDDGELCQRLMDQLLHAQGGLDSDAVEQRMENLLQAFKHGFTQAL
ncbi:MAG: nucleotidyl transferase AbiEii/AbiGii toxin family protein [Comamonadaceae bacterium]|nr:nucleotidyl transferase AbiEii/AbiGii toxin family protein [Comamonadaceae bacterium]